MASEQGLQQLNQYQQGLQQLGHNHAQNLVAEPCHQHLVQPCTEQWQYQQQVQHAAQRLLPAPQAMQAEPAPTVEIKQDPRDAALFRAIRQSTR
jgi:hypothetical protein